MFGEGALHSKRVSKRHLRFGVERDERLVVQDLDSHNGVRVDGTALTRATLRPGSVVAFGGMLLHALRCPTDVRLGGSIDFAGVGPTAHGLERALSDLCSNRRHVLVSGAAGSGKDHFVRALHARAESASLQQIQAADDRSPAEDDRLLAAAKFGILYIDGIEQASAATQRLLRRVLLTEPDGHVRLVASKRGPAAEESTDFGIPPELLARLGRWTVALPKLSERREDLPALVSSLCAARGITMEIHPRALELLCLRPWPANLHELEALLVRAQTRIGDSGVFQPSMLDPEIATPPEATGGVEIRRDADWFVTEAGGRVELGGRPTLRRLLAALLRSHDEDRYRRLTAADLAAAGWPSEDPSTKALTNRVYTAMSTLRNLGLRDALDRSSEGYRLSPEIEIRSID